ncbi:MAG TPA: hypothetical protein VK449_05960 [Anaerolineales bacterium]|nr:hypothetical protein [Anaerolineales bacterium]
MLILLPIAAFAAIFLVLLGESRRGEGPVPAGGSFVRAFILWGAFVSISSEALSLAGALTQPAVAAAWLAALLGTILWGWRRGSLRSASARLASLWRGAGSPERWVGGAIALVALTLLVVAWTAPPNNVDSLLYHMARVVHWAQDHSLRHYATARDHQLLKPIAAETMILHLRLLWGSDHPANLVQWFAMIGSIVGAVTVAGGLGGRRVGLLLTAAFVATIPMGILQATSTQNDYVVALWAIATAFLVTQAVLRPPPLLDKICLALVLGLGFLTKGTFYVYAPLFVVWYFVIRWRQSGFGRMALEALAITALACALNLGFWARNVATFGGPYGTSDWLQRNLWIRFAPRPAAAAPAIGTSAATPTPQEAAAAAQASPSAGQGLFGAVADLAARVLRTAAFNLVTPLARVNDLVLAVLARAPAVFDQKYLASWREVAWNHEDTAPNPIHFLVLILSAVAVLLPGLWPLARANRLYVLVALGSYALIPLVIGHGPTIWGIRYQLPFFVLAAPFVAWAAGRIDLRLPGPLIAAGIILLALPWLLLNNTRPLVGRTPWPTRIDSILRISAPQVLLASNPRLLSSYVEGTDLVRESGCRQVGLRIDSDDLEYAFWWLLRAPQSGIRIETIYTTERLQPLIDPTFHPCAILCTICGQRDRLHGLPLAADLDRLDVFLGPNFVKDPDG